MSFTTLRMSTRTPHEWTLDDDFIFQFDWLPSASTLQSWCAMGLDIKRDNDGNTVIRVPRGTTTDLGSSPRAASSSFSSFSFFLFFLFFNYCSCGLYSYNYCI